jgi:signal transduction histidine kinase
VDSANITGHGISPAVRPFRLALFPAAAALALAAEWVSFDRGDEPGLVVADGVVGFVLVGAAVLAWDRRGKSLVGPLMGLAGLAWFAGNFWPAVLFFHRGPLVHLHLSYPTGRLRWRPAQVTVAAAYVSAAVEPFARNDVLTLVLAGLVAIVSATAFLRTSGTARRAGVPALGAALAFAGVLALGAVNRLAGWQVDRGMLWVYEAVVAGAVLVLLADLLRGRWADAVVTDLVVDLGSRDDTGTLRDELGRALGDPSLMLGYWLPHEGRYVDDAGRPLDLTEHDPGRVVTPIEHGGEPVAVLVHDAAVLDDPGLVDAVAAAARLAVANARLQADARERVAALAASRRRIVEAAHAQRRQLAGELNQGVQRRLDGVAELLDDVRSCAAGPGAALLDEADAELRTARAEIDEFAQGIHPGALTEGGLAAALPALAGRTGLPVQLMVATGRLPVAIEAVVYFVCSEALTNVTKYASAAHVSVDVGRSGDRVTVTIADDGIGGADPNRGSGLRGLADRVAALGGRLTIESPTGIGTRLLGTLPIEVADSEQA